MTDWLNGFFIPLIEITFLVGIVGFIAFFVFKAFFNAWSKSFKFFLRYKLGRKQYPEQTIKWIMECIDRGIGYYDAKKMLMINMYPMERINETMWIFDQVINQLNKDKGGIKNGQKIARSNSKDESQATTFPTF